jgi:hypothetical protein
MRAIGAGPAAGIRAIPGLLLCAVLAACGGGGGGGGDTAQGVYYANWTCGGSSQCASVMGGPSGSTGPFSTLAACNSWCATYIPGACSCSGTPNGGGGGGQAAVPTISGFTPSTGGAGTTVTITGTNFPAIGQISVTINGVTAVIVSAGSTQIVITIPAMSASVGPIIVTTPSGTFQSADFFTVIAPHVPSVYWTEHHANGAVKTVGVAGGAPTTLAFGLSYPRAIKADSTSLYWIEYDSIGNTNGALKKLPISGGTVTTLASGLGALYGIAVDAASVYWMDGSAIRKMGLNGGASTPLVTGLSPPLNASNALALDAANVYWIDTTSVNKVPIGGGTAAVNLASGLSAASAIAVDSTSVYWVDNTNFAGSGTLSKVAIGGGTVTPLSSNLNAAAIAVDAASVYWSEIGATGIALKSIQKVAIAGGAAAPVASTLGQNFPSFIVLDASSVFWAEVASNTVGLIRKVAKTGGTVTPLASNQFLPFGVTVDGAP